MRPAFDSRYDPVPLSGKKSNSESASIRLWSCHPRYLDPQGLVVLWREALLAQAVIRGLTRGYQHHPQLHRFLASTNPESAIGTYLSFELREAVDRGYHFNEEIIFAPGTRLRLHVTTDQLEAEIAHLRATSDVSDIRWARRRLGTHAMTPRFVVRSSNHPLLCMA